MISSVNERKRSRMEVPPVTATVPTVFEKDYTFQSISKISDTQYKVTDTIYNVVTYDKNGKLDQSTNIRYLDYII